MKNLLVSLLLCCASVPGWANQPTDASLRALFAEMKLESMMDGMYASLEPIIRQSMASATAGKEVTPQQKKAMELYPQRMSELMRSELSWAKLEPMQMKIYRESFDQAEIDGLIAFYRSPVGRSFTTKMPVVTQKAMMEMQQVTQQFMPKLQAAMQELIKEVQAAK
jgi:uncharacterized protein